MGMFFTDTFTVDYTYIAPVPIDPTGKGEREKENILIEKVLLPDGSNVRGFLSYETLKKLETICLEHAHICLSKYSMITDKALKSLQTRAKIQIDFRS